MSHLRIYVDNSDSSLQQGAAPACGEAPPLAPLHGPRPVDGCRIALPLTLDLPNPPAPRQILFDRVGDAFILSPQNTPDNLLWVNAQQNLPSVLDTLRLTGGLLRSAGRRAAADRYSVGFLLWISRYVTTGRVPNDGADMARLNEADIEGMLLEFFTGSRANGLASLVGHINLLRREANLSEEVRARIQRITGILDLVPAYQVFSAHFFSEEFLARLGSLSEADFTRVGHVYAFLRRAVILLAQNRPLRFDAQTLEAVRAYAQLFQREIAAGTRPDFCAALQAALEERGGTSRPGSQLLSECRAAISLASLPAVEALRESLRGSLTGDAGLSLLQQGIREESARANLRLDWLRRRDSFGRVFAAVLENISLAPAAEGATAPRLSFNASQFRQALRLMTVLADRGEYDLSSLALLRRLFGSEGAPPRLRAFADGYFQELDWYLSPEDLRQIRELTASVATRRRASEAFVTTGMPALFGAGCALGVGGLVLSQTVPAIRGDHGLQLGMGTAAAGLSGGGCLGLAGHYVWPAALPRAVHNRYAWDLGSSAVGTGLGIGTYLLIHFLTGGAGSAETRFPTDGYGP